MQIIYRLHLDNTIMALLAIALLVAIVSAAILAAKSLYDAQTQEIQLAFDQVSAAP